MLCVYKILRPAEWAAFQAAEQFDGAPIDLTDGYVHLSGPDQVAQTLALYFADEPAPVIVACDAERLGEGLCWERSRGGALFPHFYGVLERRHVVVAASAPQGDDGVHLLPAFVR